MKVVTLLGSPRKKGNTATVLAWLEEELVRHGHEFERIRLADYKLNGCLECYKCLRPDAGYACAQEDEANHIYRKMAGADAVVIASPLFCWEFSAQLKPLIDRMFSQVKGYGTSDHRTPFQGKPAALLVTCLGPIEGNADLIQEAFERLLDYIKMKPAGRLVVPFCTRPETIPPEAKIQAEQLARTLASG